MDLRSTQRETFHSLGAVAFKNMIHVCRVRDSVVVLPRVVPGTVRADFAAVSVFAVNLATICNIDIQQQLQRGG